MREYVIKIDELCVGYRGVPLLKDISFSIKQGEILTLIGPNGAGKSTILKTLARHLATLGGTVFMDGRQLETYSGKELSQKMALVFTQKLKTEMMTCEEVVATGRYPYTGAFGILSQADREIVADTMKLVQIEDLKNRDFNELSDGQRQRVMLARCLCQEPEIVVLDEPTSFLDVRYKLEFLSLLMKLRRDKNLTVLMSLHELDLAQKVSDKILCVGVEGMERFGTPGEIFESGYITKLFDITVGSFEEASANMELEKNTDTPTTFVIAGGGTGREIYHSLQRQGTTFVTGILYENDLDYPIAKALAAETISAKAFEPVPRETLSQAKKWVERCSQLICAKEQFGTYEKDNEALLTYTKSLGKEIVLWQK